jgi:methylphosphotriester-DNA--protein-cysteine methyltransferase
LKIRHKNIGEKELRNRIRRQEITLGGNDKLKIYGQLKCASGKRLKKENRVFFRSEKEARAQGFRPCGHCLPNDYKKWKDGLV